MKRHLLAVATFLLIGVTATAQEPRRVYTRPTLPPDEVLERLNLQRAWQTFVPSGGTRDGIATVQVLDDMVLVQTRGGVLAALDPEDGSTRWRNQVGIPYRGKIAPGYNARSILVFVGARLYSLDRRTGSLQWEFESPTFPSAPPSADDARFFFTTTTGRLLVYAFPQATPPANQGSVPAPAAAAPAVPVTPVHNDYDPIAVALGPLSYVGRGKMFFRESPAQPAFQWEYRVLTRLTNRPILTGDLVAVADTEGIYYVLTKNTPSLQYSVATTAEVVAPLNQYGPTVYVAARNFNLYAVDVDASQILWRFTADRPILRRPVVTDTDVYLAPEKGGLFRIDRLTGREVWRNPEAERFVALNKHFVYAYDDHGRLLVLDRAVGTLLSAVNLRDFTFPVTNERTDRIYLAANDGTIVALRDRGYPKPLRVKDYKEPVAKPDAAAPEAKPAAEKGDEKPAEKENAKKEK